MSPSVLLTRKVSFTSLIGVSSLPLNTVSVPLKACRVNVIRCSNRSVIDEHTELDSSSVRPRNSWLALKNLSCIDWKPSPMAVASLSFMSLALAISISVSGALPAEVPLSRSTSARSCASVTDSGLYGMSASASRGCPSTCWSMACCQNAAMVGSGLVYHTESPNSSSFTAFHASSSSRKSAAASARASIQLFPEAFPSAGCAVVGSPPSCRLRFGPPC